MPKRQDPIDPSARTHLTSLITGYMGSQVLNVAARLGLADILRDGNSRSYEELASATETHPRSLHRLLRALAAVGVLEESDAGRFTLTSLGQPLRSDVPDSLRDFAIFFCGDLHWRAWRALLHSVQSGETAASQVFGVSPFEYFARHPDEGKAFNDGQTALTRLVASAVTKTYDFSPFAVIADIGGGNGTLLATVLAANPQLSGILFDLTTGLQGASELLEEAGVGARCRVVAGNFFEGVPEEADAHLLKSVIHNWNDTRAVAILMSCRRALLGTNGRVLIIERVMPERVAASPTHIQSTMSDLNMLLLPGGQERTEAEFHALLTASGFRLMGITPLPGPVPYAVIECAPA
jgi:orsellinic acid C2-O-methyltransferase